MRACGLFFWTMCSLVFPTGGRRTPNHATHRQKVRYALKRSTEVLLSRPARYVHSSFRAWLVRVGQQKNSIFRLFIRPRFLRETRAERFIRMNLCRRRWFTFARYFRLDLPRILARLDKVQIGSRLIASLNSFWNALRAGTNFTTANKSLFSDV